MNIAKKYTYTKWSNCSLSLSFLARALDTTQYLVHVFVFMCACVCAIFSFFCQILSHKRDNHPEVIIYMSFGQIYDINNAQIAIPIAYWLRVENNKTKQNQEKKKWKNSGREIQIWWKSKQKQQNEINKQKNNIVNYCKYILLCWIIVDLQRNQVKQKKKRYKIPMMKIMEDKRIECVIYISTSTHPWLVWIFFCFAIKYIWMKKSKMKFNFKLVDCKKWSKHFWDVKKKILDIFSCTAQ